LGVEAAGLAESAKDVNIALVRTEADLTVDTLLSRNDCLIEPLTLRGEIHAIVKALGPLDSHKLIPKLADLRVKDKTLEIDVSKAGDGETRGVVATSALESNPSVLDTV
jgi:hypothetical protein